MSILKRKLGSVTRRKITISNVGLVFVSNMFQLDEQGDGSDFNSDFSDVDGFDFDVDGELTEEGFESLEKKIREMSIGHRLSSPTKETKIRESWFEMQTKQLLLRL